MTLITLAINPVPAGAVTGIFDGYDGRKLRYACWQPTRGPVRGTVCIFTGRGEYIEKYFEVVADLRPATRCRHSRLARARRLGARAVRFP